MSALEFLHVRSASHLWSQPLGKRIILVLAMVLGGILRFAALGRQPLWLDEATDASFAARSFWNCIFAESAHPPLYRALLHFVVLGFGNSSAVVRFLPAVFGILAIPVMAALARRIYPAAEFATMALAATSPFLIYYSQENRDYSLFILLALVSTWAFLRLRETANGLMLYSALSILLLYTHYLAVFVLLAHEIVYWIYARQRIGKWLLARSAVALAFIPWVVWIAERYQGESRLFLPPLLLVPVALLRFLLGYGIVSPDSALRAKSASSILIEEGPVVIPALCLYGWLLWRGARQNFESTEIKTLLGSIVFLPWLILLLLSPWAMLAHERYLAFQAPFILICVAAGVSSLPGRTRIWATVALSLVITFSLSAYFGAPGNLFGYRLRFAKENWAGTAAFVQEQRADAVIVAPGYLSLPLDRYDLSGSREIYASIAASVAAIPELTDARRTALVLSHAGAPEERFRGMMDAEYPRIAEAKFTSQNAILVIIYDTAATASPVGEGSKIFKLETQRTEPSR